MSHMSFTGQAKALGGYNAETAQGERATAIHMEHATCSAIATGKKTAEMRFTAHRSTGIPNLRPGATSLVLVVPSAGNAPRRPAPTEQQRNSKKQRNSKGGTAQQQEIHEELFGTDTGSSSEAAPAPAPAPRSTHTYQHKCPVGGLAPCGTRANPGPGLGLHQCNQCALWLCGVCNPQCGEGGGCRACSAIASKAKEHSSAAGAPASVGGR